MNQALQLGPFVVPFSLLLVLVAVAAGLLVGKRVGRRSGLDIEAKVWQSLLAGILLARIVFVWEYRAEYQGEPLDILDLRDGGWSAIGGFAGAWIFVLGLQVRHRLLANPLNAAMGTATVVWLAGTLALAVQEGESPKLPNLSLATLEGGRANLADFTGSPTVVNLWATWCPPCVREMPMLQRAQRDYPSVRFVFVNHQESADKVNAWLAARHMSLQNVLLDRSGQTGAAFDQRALPTTLFFGADGRLAGMRIGELSRATLVRELRTVGRGEVHSEPFPR